MVEEKYDCPYCSWERTSEDECNYVCGLCSSYHSHTMCTGYYKKDDIIRCMKAHDEYNLITDEVIKKVKKRD